MVGPHSEGCYRFEVGCYHDFVAVIMALFRQGISVDMVIASILNTAHT